MLLSASAFSQVCACNLLFKLKTVLGKSAAAAGSKRGPTWEAICNVRSTTRHRSLATSVNAPAPAGGRLVKEGSATGWSFEAQDIQRSSTHVHAQRSPYVQQAYVQHAYLQRSPPLKFCLGCPAYKTANFETVSVIAQAHCFSNAASTGLAYEG